MPINYKAISDANTIEYGTGVARYGQRFANLYHERTHFIFELLQNAEDALRKRTGEGSRTVCFDLSQEGLQISHFGKPFDERDVQGICGIGEGSKETDLTQIGRFGIGFKSVYNFTDRPEVHSASEHFAIERFVHPVAVNQQYNEPEQTVIRLPFRHNDLSIFGKIAKSLESLKTRSLLFLREIEEVVWSVEDGGSGRYYREVKEINQQLRKVTLVWEKSPSTEMNDEEWLIFSNPILNAGQVVGAVEIALNLKSWVDETSFEIKAISDSHLVVFFPTSVPTGMGFVFQGPFQTTPSRDNVPPEEEWNQYLIEEMASLLIKVLGILRDKGALSVAVLQGLPLKASDFPESSMFAPVYRQVVEALQTQSLLPTYGGGWKSSQQVALARGQGLRELLSPKQLAELMGSDQEIFWLNDEITADRTPDLRSYLMKEHQVSEITPDTIITKMTKEFLERQSDQWMIQLYRFLKQTNRVGDKNFKSKSWVRLENGRHVVALIGSAPQAFLPSSQGDSGFETVRRTVCENSDALDFLKSLGLTEPDPVDDIIANLLPQYASEETKPDLELYEKHLIFIQNAFAKPYNSKKSRLIAELKEVPFVRAVDVFGNLIWLRPNDCYLPTDKLRKLFAEVADIYFVDQSVAQLQGEIAEALLLECGVSKYLRLIECKSELSWEERVKLRGNASFTSDRTEDHTLHGLSEIVAKISILSLSDAKERSSLLWDCLIDMVREKRDTILTSVYFWKWYRTERSAIFPAKFVRTLKQAKWIPDESGDLTTPNESVFERIKPEWTEHLALQKELGFKPPLIERLAKEAGIDPAILDYLIKENLTLEQLQTRYPSTIQPHRETEQKAPLFSLVKSPEFSPQSESTPPVRPPSENSQNAFAQDHSSSTPSEQRQRNGSTSSAQSKRDAFISYVAVGSSEPEENSTEAGQTQSERLEIEQRALDYICTLEPDLQRTNYGNAGYDLFERNDTGDMVRWVEVKSLQGTLENHPVGLSKSQFEMAQQKGDSYWLYIVENTTSEQPILHKIQNPAGKARTFTFDSGWRAIAETVQLDKETGEIISIIDL